MSEISASQPFRDAGNLTLTPLLVDQQSRWRRGERVLVEAYLARQTPLDGDSEAVLELILHELLLRQKGGEAPTLSEYQRRFPHLAGPLEVQFAVERAIAGGSLSAATLTAPALSPSRPAAVPGYEVLEELGRGAMGVVYKARHLRLNRVVALKMVLSGGYATTEERMRFLAEAEAIAAVKHPGIVQVFDFGTHDGQPFFSLEFCEGGSLAGKLAGNPLPVARAARLVEEMARAVQAAHEKGIVHRDLKPANVLLDEQGRPRVADFGLAKRCAIGAGLRQAGAVMGTPSYMAPEQAQGKKDICFAADVYALGAILYECLAGRPPFKAATTYDTLHQVVNDEAVPPRKLNKAVPQDLETICLKCLQKDPARRYGSAAELADDLGRWLAGEPIAARPASRTERAVKWARRRPTVAALLAAVVLLGAAGLGGIAWAYGEALRERDEARAANCRRVLAQVEQLRTATASAVPSVLAGLEPDRGSVGPLLRALWQRGGPSRRERMRVGLALLAEEPDAVKGPLTDWMLDVHDPGEMLLVRDALKSFGDELKGPLWRKALDLQQTSEARFHALVALAAFDPNNPRWDVAGPGVIEELLAANPLHLAAWVPALRPVRQALLAPLGEVFRGKRLPEQKRVAAIVLADYAADRPETLVELVMEADDRQLATLLPVLRQHRERAIPLLAGAVERKAPPAAAETEREELARRQSGAALALARLGRVEAVWPLLAHSPYPEARTRLIHRLESEGVTAATLAARLETEQDVSIRRALILALGEYRAAQVPAELRQRLTAKLCAWYRDDPDAGIHGAIDWLLRHGKEGPADRPLDWGQGKALARIDAELAAPPRVEPARAGRGWYVNGQGQTLTVVEARQPFLLGSPADEAGRREDENLHWRQIGRRYAIGTKPVTVAEFARFRKAHPEVQHSYMKQYSPVAEGPIIAVTWYDAAQYCRWLSEQDGFPKHEMVYPSSAEIEKCKNGGAPLRLPANYLIRKGYRLPTEAEWEYACRAGARTSRYYGSAAELLPRYAWFLGNSKDRTWPVGQKKPNDFGLFDMHGNVWTWCQESGSLDSTETVEGLDGGKEDRKDISDCLSRVLRGASCLNHRALVRAAQRNDLRPPYRSYTVGVRVARTCDARVGPAR